MAINIEKAGFGYDEKCVVPSFTTEFAAGTITALIGPNGSGKSTILRGLARILQPISGTVLLEGKDLRKYDTTVLARSLAVLPQFHPVGEDVCVRELVALGRFAHSKKPGNTRKGDEEAVAVAIKAANLEALAHRPVASLSGGERQRAWIALVLAQEAKVLLLDEPTTYLDIRYQFEILDLIGNMNRLCGLTVIMALHDLNHAARFAHRVIALKEGRVAADGPPAEVIRPSIIQDVFGIEGIVSGASGHPHFIPTGINGSYTLS